MWETVESWWLAAAVALPGGALYWLSRPLAIKVWQLIAGPVRAHFAGVERMVSDVATMKDEVSSMKGEISAISRRVEGELGPNGGGSMKDQVTIIAARQAAIFDSMARPAFQADASGRFMSVNRAFEMMTGYPARDLVGMGWVNLIHQDHVEAFMVAWEHTIRDGRILRRECLLVTSVGDELAVCVDAVPVKAGARVLEWQGTFASPETV